MKYFLFSRKKIIVEYMGEIFKLSASNSVAVEAGQFVKVFGQEQNFLPFCFEVATPNANIHEVQFSQFVMLEILPKNLPSGSYYQSKNFENGVATVSGFPLRASVAILGEVFDHDLPCEVGAVEIKIQKFAVVFFGRLNDGDYCLIFHKNSKKFVEILGSIDLSDGKILAVENRKTFARHGRLIELEFHVDGIVETGNELVYLNQKPAIVAPFLSHIAFFEAVREKDYFLAKSYLTPEFSAVLSPQHFEEFFGDFQQILPIKQGGVCKIALIKNLNQQKSQATVFLVEFEGGKIKNIQLE